MSQWCDSSKPQQSAGAFYVQDETYTALTGCVGAVIVVLAGFTSSCLAGAALFKEPAFVRAFVFSQQSFGPFIGAFFLERSMPERFANDPMLRQLGAVILAMIAGLVARTLMSNEQFNPKRFVGELILAVMFGIALFAFGMIQALDFWQTILMAMLSGMGTTRSLEMLLTVSKAVRGQ